MRASFIFLLIATAASAEVSLQRFSGTFGVAHDLGEVEMQELDTTPLAIPTGLIEFPAELKGFGIVGNMHCMASIKADGTVHWVVADSGIDMRFRKPVERAVMAWHFTSPLLHSKPVAAYVHFSVVFTETQVVQVVVGKIPLPNQSPDPALASGTSPARQEPRHP